MNFQNRKIVIIIKEIMNSRFFVLVLLVIGINVQFLPSPVQPIPPQILPPAVTVTPVTGTTTTSSSSSSSSYGSPYGDNNCCSSKLHIVYVVEDTKQTSPQARDMFKKFVRISRWMAAKVSLFEIRGIPYSKYDPLKAKMVSPHQIMDKFNTQPPINQDYQITLGDFYYHPELYLGHMLQTGNVYHTRIVFLSEANILNYNYNPSNGPYQNLQDYLTKFYWVRVVEYEKKSNCPVQFYCYYYNPGQPIHLGEYTRMCNGFYSQAFENLDS